MSTRYEYTLKKWRSFDYSDIPLDRMLEGQTFKKNPQSFVEFLNVHGAGGWKVVSITDVRGLVISRTDHEVVFMREVE